MVERDKQEDKQENISASGLSPFKSAIFRTLWIAALFASGNCRNKIRNAS
jgi:hypothetical protein